MKAFLGMGLLGSNFVKALLKKGGHLHVWNRTLAKAKLLEPYGAKAFEQAHEAVQYADIIHVTLKDDASVDEVLEKASKGFKPGVIIVDHTTTSAKGATQRFKLWNGKAVHYIHAPVFMGPANALNSTGIMLVSGDQQVIEAISQHLAKMTGKLVNLGSEHGKAAAIKLVGNSFLLTLTAGLSEVLAVAKSHSVSTKEILDLLGYWNPGALTPERLKRIIDAKYDDPSWELSMARKDAALMLDAANEAGVKLSLLPVIADVMDGWIAKGHGNEDWSVIAKDNVRGIEK